METCEWVWGMLFFSSITTILQSSECGSPLLFAFCRGRVLYPNEKRSVIRPSLLLIARRFPCPSMKEDVKSVEDGEHIRFRGGWTDPKLLSDGWSDALPSTLTYHSTVGSNYS
jgi:hypothetical protein